MGKKPLLAVRDNPEVPVYAKPAALSESARRACETLGANQLRMALLATLQAAGGTLTTAELTEAVGGASIKSVLNHLRDLEALGLLSASQPGGSARRGRVPTRWTLNRDAVDKAVDDLAELLTKRAAK